MGIIIFASIWVIVFGFSLMGMLFGGLVYEKVKIFLISLVFFIAAVAGPLTARTESFIVSNEEIQLIELSDVSDIKHDEPSYLIGSTDYSSGNREYKFWYKDSEGNVTHHSEPIINIKFNFESNGNYVIVHKIETTKYFYRVIPRDHGFSYKYIFGIPEGSIVETYESID